MLQTKQEFTDFQLHVEFATPAEVKGDSQERGNSGVFLLGKFEIQVLDSYRQSHVPGWPGRCDVRTASAAGERVARVPASGRPTTSSSPRPASPRNPTLEKPAIVTVIHNGVLVHNGAAFTGPTRHRSVLPYTPDMAKGRSRFRTTETRSVTGISGFAELQPVARVALS